MCVALVGAGGPWQPDSDCAVWLVGKHENHGHVTYGSPSYLVIRTHTRTPAPSMVVATAMRERPVQLIASHHGQLIKHLLHNMDTHPPDYDICRERRARAGGGGAHNS